MGRRSRGVARAALLLLVTASCGGSSGHHVPDAAGTGPRDAAPDVQGSDGRRDAAVDQRTDGPTAPDAGPLGACLGTCLESFLAPCERLDQSCISQTVGSTISSCYANGVKVSSTVTGNVTVSTYYRPDGQVCYVATRTGLTAEDIKSPSGVLLGHIMFDETQTHLTVSCYPNGASSDPEVTMADLTQPNCAAYYAAGTQQCTTGACAP